METPIHLPVVKVTVLEDRALVERRGEVLLPAGPQRLRLEGLSPLAVDRSLQAQLSGGAVAQARLHRTWKDEKPDAWLQRRGELGERVESLHLDVLRAQAEVQRLKARQELVNVAREDVLRSIAEAAGFGRAQPDTWSEQLERVRQEATAADEALSQATRQEVKARLRLAEARQALGRSAPPETKLITSAVLEVEHPGGTASLRVAYLVPCAVWRPAYRATLAPAEGARP